MQAETPGRAGLSLLDLVRHRLTKHGRYDTPAYWDLKATAYEGLRRSMWPSESYNRQSHVRQMALLDEIYRDVDGQRIVDVGCGTGRASRSVRGSAGPHG